MNERKKNSMEFGTIHVNFDKTQVPVIRYVYLTVSAPLFDISKFVNKNSTFYTHEQTQSHSNTYYSSDSTILMISTRNAVCESNKNHALNRKYRSHTERTQMINTQTFRYTTRILYKKNTHVCVFLAIDAFTMCVCLKY